MQKLDVTPQECLVIEDSLVGIEAAHNAGIDVIAMFDSYAKHEEAELRQRSLGYFEDYKALFGALKEELGKN